MAFKESQFDSLLLAYACSTQSLTNHKLRATPLVLRKSSLMNKGKIILLMVHAQITGKGHNDCSCSQTSWGHLAPLYKVREKANYESTSSKPNNHCDLSHNFSNYSDQANFTFIYLQASPKHWASGQEMYVYMKAF